MKVFIVTENNGRVHSVHFSQEDAEKERARAVGADEIWATCIEDYDVREHVLCIGDKVRISRESHLWYGDVGIVCDLPEHSVYLLVSGCAVSVPRGYVEWVP